MSKTILITGATDGIGLLTAQMLASDGHSVILHGRSDDKLQAAVSQVGGAPATYRADLSVVEEARALAQAVAKDHTQIDVLINNAGVLKAPKTVLDNGQDLRFVVNTLAPYALTMALLPKMPKDGRILNLSSAAQATVNLSALRGGVRLDDMDAYAQSKRAITLWSAHLAQTLADGPLVFAVNPGLLLASKMVKEGFGVAGHDLRIGADILCRLALKDGFDDQNGAYWDNDAGRFASVDLSQMEDVVATIEALVKGN